MKYELKRDGSALTAELEGRLDTTAAPGFQEVLQKEFDGTDTLTFDLEKLDYISSAGLRVLLQAHKRMNGQGRMVLRNVGESILEIFEVTGFTEILTIE